MRTKLNITIIVTLSLLWLALAQGVCLGATYYLDAVKGDDSNPGTSAAPWQTLNRAYTWYGGAGAKVQEGDTVLFRDGNYGSFSESNINRNDWVTYKADAGHKPILTSIGINNGNLNSYLIFDGFNITGGVGIQYISYFKVLNSTIQKQPAPVSGYYEPYFYPGSVAVWSEHTNHITIQGNDISNTYRGMRILDATDWLLKDNTIHHISEDGFSYPSGGNSVIEGNYIYDHRRFTTVMAIHGTKKGDFESGEVVTMPGTDATGIVYRWKTTSSGGYLQVYPTSKTTFYTYWWQNQNRYIVGQTNGATINPISDVDPPHTDGFQIHGSASNIIIRGNIIDRTRYVGPGSEDGQGFKLSGGSSGITLENNLVIAGKTAILMGTFDLRVYNNTLIGGAGVDLRDKWSDSIITEMYNNIIERLIIINDPGNIVGIDNHGNNIFGNHPSGGEAPFVFVVDPSTELTNYPVDGLFVDAAGGDFHLVAGSVAIDFGDPAYAPATDIDGNPRDSKPDAGCYEYIILQRPDESEDKTEVKCYNNVFNPTKGEEALIWVELPKQARVKVDLYNTRGKKIRKLVDEERDAETCKYYWNGKDDSGNVVGSGLYFVHIQAGDYKKTKKIVVVK